MNENAEPSSIARDGAVAYELSRDASLMWWHYETVQTCERNLAMGQQTGLKHTSSTETDSLTHNDTEERGEEKHTFSVHYYMECTFRNV